MSNLQPNYMKNQMQSAAAQAAIGQEPVCRTVTFAITGDEETDIIAGIIAVIGNTPKRGGNPSREFQRICEYLASRFKAQADENDKAEANRDRMGAIGLAGTNPLPAEDYSEFRNRMMADWHRKESVATSQESNTAVLDRWAKDQSGTHSPSSQYPDSTEASSVIGSPFGKTGAEAAVESRERRPRDWVGSGPDWPEDGSVMKGPPSPLGG